MNNRLHFALVATTLLAATFQPAHAEDTRVRLMAANLTMEAGQTYGANGIRIFKGLKPDIAMLQEFRFQRGTPQDMREFVDTAFGKEFVLHGAEQSGNEGLLPNGIISRYPFKATGQWEDENVGNRDFTWACIDIPGPVDLYAISVHLKAGGEAGRRQAQAKAIVEQIKKNVPEGAWVVIAGDFNTKNREEECVKTLSSVFTVEAPFPTDTTGNENTNANRNKPYDWVLVNGGLDRLETPVILPDMKPFVGGLVFDSTTFPNLGAVTPVQSDDSHSLGMQHMAVIRDFLVPSSAK